MKKIEMGKQYRTRGTPDAPGGPVRLLCVDAPGDYPVVAVDADGEVRRWTAYGTWSVMGQPSCRDLIEIRERVRWEGWANVYPGGLAAFETTREDADRNAGDRRIACVRVVIDCEVGEGLEGGR